MTVKNILLLSGGLDSLVLLARETQIGNEVICVSIAYGQRHIKELYAAETIARHYHAQYLKVEIPLDLIGKPNSLTGNEPVPQGIPYDDPKQSATVVPNRNMIFLSIAAAVAVAHGAGKVLIGSHAGDHAVYPDCRPEFTTALSQAMELSCGVSVEAPFACMTKREIVQLGKELFVPFSMAWTCYMGMDQPCGTCGSCREREEAMR